MPFDSPSAPPPPDPAATAAAQASANRETAITQAGLNMTNQNTPYGTLTYNQIGTWPGVNGGPATPRYEANTTLSPAEQGIFNLGTQTRGNLAQIGSTQSAKIGDILNTPFNIEAARGTKLADINRTFLDPQWNQARAGLDADLINRGVRPGSEAYTRAVTDFENQKANAYNNMYLSSYGQANTAALTERNLPLNEISALMSGSQVNQPNFVNTPNTNVAPTDVIGPTYSSYQGQLQNYNASLNRNNAMMGSLFGIPATIAGGWALGGFRGL